MRTVTTSPNPTEGLPQSGLPGDSAPDPVIDSLRERWVGNPYSEFQSWLVEQDAGRTELAPRTLKQYGYQFRAFVDALPTLNASMISVSPAEIEVFLGRIGAKPKAGGAASEQETIAVTRRRYLNLLDRVFSRLVEDGVRRDNPAKDLLRRHVNKAQEKPVRPLLSAAKCQEYIDVCRALAVEEGAGDPINWIATRNHALRLIFIGGGLSVEEVTTLRVGSHRRDPAGGSFFHISPHGKVLGHHAPLETFASKAFREWLSRLTSFAEEFGVAGQEGGVGTLPAFVGCRQILGGYRGRPDLTRSIAETEIYMAVNTVLARIQVDSEWGPRILRNSFIAMHLRAGRTAEDIRRMLGLATHKTINEIACLL